MEPIELHNRFKYHAPDSDKVLLHEDVREFFGNLAVTMNRILPEGREKALVMTKLEEGMMWSNAAIARNVVE